MGTQTLPDEQDVDAQPPLSVWQFGPYFGWIAVATACTMLLIWLDLCLGLTVIWPAALTAEYLCRAMHMDFVPRRPEIAVLLSAAFWTVMLIPLGLWCGRRRKRWMAWQWTLLGIHLFVLIAGGWIIYMVFHWQYAPGNWLQ